MAENSTTEDFNDKNLPTIDDMKHVAFMNTNLETTRKVLQQFKASFPVGSFVQPTPYGVTLFHTNTQHLGSKKSKEVESAVFSNIQKDINIDSFILTFTNPEEEPELVTEYIETARSISPDAEIIILTHDAKGILSILNDANIEYIDSDNIISLKDLSNNRSFVDNGKAFNEDELRKKITSNECLVDRTKRYEHATILRDKYFKIDSIYTEPSKIIHYIEYGRDGLTQQPS